MNHWLILLSVSSLVSFFPLPARAVPSDLEVRCFSDEKNDDGLIQSYTAEFCEEIGDAVPYFSLGRMISPQSIYNASADLKCIDKNKQECVKCLKDWKQNYRELLTLMVKSKLISKQNRSWMASALEGFHKELLSSCE